MTLPEKNERKGTLARGAIGVRTLARGAIGVPCEVSSSCALKIKRAQDEANESWRFDLRLK